MNKLSVGLLLAASLFLVNVTPAAAHQEVNRVSVYDDRFHAERRHHDAMPRWLKRDRQFRHWYRHTPLKRFRRLGWWQLYEIYRWERAYFAQPRRRYRHYD